MPKTKKTFAEFFRDARLAKGFSQYDVVALTGITQKQLSLIENGRIVPGWSIIAKLCTAYEVSRDDVPAEVRRGA